jgi:hypothetical protein
VSGSGHVVQSFVAGKARCSPKLRLVPRRLAIATALATVLTVGACGDSDDDGDGDAGRCVELWNDASPHVKERASLSHRGDTGEADILVGPYMDTEFSATGESFDESGATITDDVAVSSGDCVAVDLTSNDTQTNWVMVLATSDAGRDWYFLDETDDHPLAEPPQPLDQPARAELVGFGEEVELSVES